MVDEQWMIPNEYFSQYYPDVCIEQDMPEFSDTLKIGAFMVIQKIFQDLQIEEMLTLVFGELGIFVENIVSFLYDHK